MNYGLKEKIIKLRQEDKTYNQIQEILHCSKSIISYHCSKLENNKKLIEKNTNSYLKKTINNWNKETKNLIINLYKYSVHTTEIADILDLKLNAIKLLCKEIKYRKYSNITNYERVKRRRKKIKILGVLYKGGKCEKCGYNKFFECLEFHHIDISKKDFTISQKVNHRWITVKKEIDKCALLCSNCHRELHAEINNGSPLIISDFFK